MAERDRLQPKDVRRTDPELNMAQRVVAHVQSKAVMGLLDLLPLLVTVVVVIVLIGYADKLVEALPWSFPGMGLIVAIVVCYIVGLLVSWGPTKAAMDWKTEVIGRIPVVKGIFAVTRQATSALTSQFNFSRVVFLEWPKDGMIALGFVTARVHSPGREEALIIVYIPTVPNPTSGNMALVVEDDVFETDLSVEDAMKLVFSGGIVPPDMLSLARLTREVRSDSEYIGRFITDR